MRRGDPESAHEHFCSVNCGRHYRCPNDRCPGEWVCPVCCSEALDVFIEEQQRHNAVEENPDARLRERR